MADSRKARFQQDIIDAMTADGRWLTGSARGYDRPNALYTEDLIAFFQTAHPDRWAKFCKNNPASPEDALVKAVVRGLDRQGTLEVLRHGVKTPGVLLATWAFQPGHGRGRKFEPPTAHHHSVTRTTTSAVHRVA